MAEKTIDIRYVKSALWRAITANGVTINAIGNPISGYELLIRFSVDWVDVEKESFRAEVTPTSIQVKTQPQSTISSLFRIEEMAVRMPTAAAAALIIGLLPQLKLAPDLRPEQKKMILDETAKL